MVANLLKIAVLVCLVTWAWISGHATTANFNAAHPTPHRLRTPLRSHRRSNRQRLLQLRRMVEAGKVAGEVRNPRRTLPLAFTLGVLIVTAIYLLVSFAFLSVVPVERIVSNTAFVAQFGEALFGSVGGKVLSACVLLSVLGGLMALTMAAPRVYYAMAKDGAFFPAFGRLHPRFGTPANAVLLQTVLALLVLCFGAFDRIPLLHHLLRNLLPRPLCRLAVPAQRARNSLVAPRRSDSFSSRCTLINLLILMHDPSPRCLVCSSSFAGTPFAASSSRRPTLLWRPQPNNPSPERNSHNAPHSTSRRSTRHPRRNGLPSRRPPAHSMISSRSSFTHPTP